MESGLLRNRLRQLAGQTSGGRNTVMLTVKTSHFTSSWFSSECGRLLAPPCVLLTTLLSCSDLNHAPEHEAAGMVI